MSDEDDETIIIDNGSSHLKAGFSGELVPRCQIPSIHGRVGCHYGVAVGFNYKPYWIGDDAIKNRGMLSLSYLIQHGYITNFDRMENMWHHLFYNELRMAPEESNVLCTEKPLNPKSNREKTTEIFFEVFNVRKYFSAIDAVLALYATERTTGTVIDCGFDSTFVTPIYEGYCLPHAVIREDFGGSDITCYLQELLKDKLNTKYTNQHQRSDIVSIKEKLCYINVNNEFEIIKSKC
eukprot:67256_1